MLLAATEIDGQAVALFVISGLMACLWFLLKYWFKKMNDSQETIINDLGVNKIILTEHKATTRIELSALKEQNEASQRVIFKEINTLSKSMNNSLEKVIAKTEKNSLDIANLKSANVFISKEIKEIKKNNGK